MKLSIEDAKATQKSAVFGILVGHCGEKLSPEKVESIMLEIDTAMRSGPCAWAFEPSVET